MTPHHQPRRAWRRTSLLILAALVLVGCSPGVASPLPSDQVEPSPADTATPAPTVLPTEAAPDPIATPLGSTSAPPEPTPTARRGLQATDPGSVVLAAGRPQLVEFFAFW